ncbi:flagellar transcriptional activator FlhD [Nitrosospira sp. Nsp5]|uniref:Flagellar transcriptional regulator FlhD n=2 Tax=Nitrosomonadaceae TaxID=206379 RepID=A0ABY0TDY0_9PROT|nr:flagellar transcriptional activator FlhD [Nitrosospira sp. Nsp5]SDQ68593.1 flagellar transcriptional activator FlhD [Nitrosospira multiformis]
MDSGFAARRDCAQWSLTFKGVNMNANELTMEIKELNLTYLMLAQQMVRTDQDMAIFRLGISKDIAEILAVLTPGQILKLSNSNVMLCRIRFDDSLVLGMLANYGKEKTMVQSHAAILLAGQPVEQIS